MTGTIPEIGDSNGTTISANVGPVGLIGICLSRLVGSAIPGLPFGDFSEDIMGAVKAVLCEVFAAQTRAQRSQNPQLGPRDIHGYAERGLLGGHTGLSV
jgi:hypothetical protein